VESVQINQDPYSARYYYPGRGQMEIITKSTADAYHGEFNFYFRDSAMNAQNALAPSKPFEQRRIYEGSVLGPIPHSKNSGFLISFNRAEEDLDSVVSASIVPTVSNPSGAFNANVPAPTRDTEFSVRASHQFGNNSAYAQYSRWPQTVTTVNTAKTTLWSTLTRRFLPPRSTRFRWLQNTMAAETRMLPKRHASACLGISLQAPRRMTRSERSTTRDSQTW
jgi:hypothetical protein